MLGLLQGGRRCTVWGAKAERCSGRHTLPLWGRHMSEHSQDLCLGYLIAAEAVPTLIIVLVL